MSDMLGKAICSSIQENKDKIEKLTKQNVKLKKKNKQLKVKSDVLEENNKLLIQQKTQMYEDLDIAYERIDKAIDYIKEYGRDKQLEEDYLMNRYNLAMYNITLLEILGEKK